MKKIWSFTIFFAFTIWIVAESAEMNKKLPMEIDQCVPQKITFDLNSIDEDGLIGPTDGKASVDFEFCIPYKEQYLKEIQSIDSDIKCYYGSRGRIGCGNEEYLCIGNTGDKDYNLIVNG